VDSVLDDVRQGYVSTDRARTDYGVAFDPARGDLVIDEATTRVLRGKS